jgi:hypothetical protein
MPWVDSFYKLLPANFTRGEGEALGRALSLMLDEFQARIRAGLLARFPRYAVEIEGALERIGRDRGIPRGRTEDAKHYASRLERWRFPFGHRVRGNPFALLEQISEYWGGLYCETVDNSGNLHFRTPTGGLARLLGSWNWDGQPTLWSRFWVRLWPTPEHPEIKTWPTLGAGAWGSLDPVVNAAKTVGQQGITADDFVAMRELMYPRASYAVAWKPAGTKCPFLILSFDDWNGGTTGIDPGGAWGDSYARHSEEQISNLRFIEVRP